MRKNINRRILTLGCVILLLIFVVAANHLIGGGPGKNHLFLAAYLGLGVLSIVAAGVYLKRKGVDLGESGAIWVATVAITGGALIFAWPLLLPILVWNETGLTRLLRKHYFATNARDDLVPPSDRPLSDEEKVEAMRELTRKSPR
jgi:hypothetical protein